MLEPVVRWAADQANSGLTEHVTHHATRAIVDWVAATISGADLPPARSLRAAVVDDRAGGGAHLIPSGTPVPLRTAALINGAASHTAEVDDIFRDGVYHPGAPTIAAALAAAEDRGVSGSQLLTGVTIGYEIGNRIAAAVQPSHYRFWHTTGTVGTIGAAAAVAGVLRLDPQGFTDAIGNAATMAAGLQQAFRADAMSKPLHAGHAAEAGSLAALAASEGFTGAPDVLDGPAGFAAAMSEGTDFHAVFEDLGDRFTITETTFKNHTCCGHTFAAIDAILMLREQHALTPDQVERIRVGTYQAALEVAGNPAPTTAFEAKFSLPYTVAAALHLGSVRLGAFERHQRDDPGLRTTLGKVTLESDPQLDGAFPRQRGARVTVVTTTGEELVCERPTRRGDPELPLTDEELSEKFLELVGERLGPDRTTALLAGVWSLGEVQDLRTARPLSV